jgi:hypothetical protein
VIIERRSLTIVRASEKCNQWIRREQVISIREINDGRKDEEEEEEEEEEK